MAKVSFSSKAIGAAGLALAAVSFMASASLVTQRSAPDVALALFPMNATAQVRVAEADFADGLNARTQNPAQGGAQLARAEAMARQSLASMALNPRALKVLALADPEKPYNAGAFDGRRCAKSPRYAHADLPYRLCRQRRRHWHSDGAL